MTIIKQRGLFITVEGIDGAGKSTHVKFICDYLTMHGKKVVATRDPGGSKVGEDIRHILLHSGEKLNNVTELLLMFASRQELISQIIEPNLANGVWVVSDRFIDSSFAYQGFGRSLGCDRIKLLQSLLQSNVNPDITFLFNAPLELAATRVARHSNKDRIEEEPSEFFAQVQQGYLTLLQKEPERIKLINTDQERKATQDLIVQHLDNLLAKVNSTLN
jgi:dTMP kinase